MRHLLFVLPFLFSFFVYSQGTDCSTAILVSSNGCSAATAYTNTGVAGNITPSCFGTGNNNSMWFKFVASAPTVNITVNGSGLTQPMIALLDQPPTPPCTGTFPELSCTNTITGTSASLTYSSLVSGNVYYIIVDGKTNTAGTFQLCLTSIAKPVNDDPCNAISLQANNFCSPTDAYSNAGATGEPLTNTNVPACFDLTGPINSVYFKFTAIGAYNTVIINGSASGLSRPQASIMTINTSCSGTTFSSIGCGQATSTANSTTVIANSLAPGTTYYILVDGYTSGTGAFQICVNSYVPTSTVVNDECSNATILCPDNKYYATTKLATPNILNDPAGNANGAGGNSDWGCNNVINNIVWFTFTTKSPVQDIVFDVNSQCFPMTGSGYPNGGGLQFEVFRRKVGESPCANITPGSSWIALDCFDSYPSTSTSVKTANNLTIPAASLLPNTQYYLIVDNYPQCECDFDFIIRGNQGTSAGVDESKCLNAAAYTLPGFTPSGGTWSGPGITNAATGTFSPSTAGIGTHTLYYTQGNCTDSKVVTVTSPTVTVSNDVSICTGGSTNIIGNVTAVSTQPISLTNSSAYTIPDGGVSSTWTGNATGTFASSSITPTGLVAGYTLTSVVVNIAHEYDGDVMAYLTNGCGTTIRLINSRGSSGDNFTNTTFTPSATGLLSAGTPPYTGTFIPDAGGTSAAQWATFCACQNTSAAWTLKVGDNSYITEGTLLNWTLNFVNHFSAPTYQWTSAPASTIPNSTTSLSQTVSPTVTTAYTLTATDFFGCVNTDVVNVTVGTPVLTITNPAAVCSPGTVNITAAAVTAGSTGGGTLSYWSDAAATISLATPAAVATAGTYYIKTTSGSCSDIKPVTVSINPPPSLTITNPAAVCSPGTVNITAAAVTAGSTGSGTLSYWTNVGATTALATPAAVTTGGTYYIKSTVGTCTDIKPVTVTINASPVLTITNPTAVCSPLTVDLSAAGVTTGSTGSGTLSYWTTVAATTSLTSFSTVAASGTYYIKSTVGTCTDIKPVTVTVNTSPVLTITSPAAVCSPLTVDITASGVTTGSTGVGTLTYWSNVGLTTSVATPSAISTGGTYYIKATSSVGGCVDSKTVSVTINNCSCPVILTTTDPAAVCSPLTVDLTAPAVKSSSSTGGAVTITYWTDAAATVSLASPAAVAVSGVYYIKSDDGTCHVIKPVTVTINTKPNLIITNPAAVCSPITVDITASAVTTGSTGGGTLTYWSDAGCTSSIVSPSSINTGATYYIKSTLGSCTDSKPVLVTINATPVLTIINPNGACPPATVDITAPAVTVGSTGGGTLTYFNDLACSSTLASPATVAISGTYYIKSTNVTCTDVKPVVVSISAPVLTITNPLAVCSPNTVDITASAVTVGSTGNGVLTYFTDAGCTAVLSNPSVVSVGATYYIKSTSGICSDSKPVTVTINTKPSLTITNPASVCSPSTVDITAAGVTLGSTGGGTLSYWTDASASSTLATPTAVAVGGTYYIKSLLGTCFDIQPVLVTVNTTPSLTIIDPSAVCTPSSVNLTGAGVTTGSTGGGTLSYWTDALATSALATPSAVTTTGTYYIKALLGTCFDIKPVVATVNTTPVLTITNPATVCSPLTVDITTASVTSGSTGAGTLSYWTNLAGTTSLPNTTAITTSATYYIKSANGVCSDIKPVVVTITPTPSISVTTPAAVCSPSTVNITNSGIVSVSSGAIPPLTYWTDAGATTSLTTPAAINTSGTYYFKAVNGLCFDIQPIVVTINATPSLTITPPSPVCSPLTADITAGAITAGSTGGGVLTYWRDAAATSSLGGPNALATTGTYYIKSTLGSCYDVKSVLVTVNTTPSLTIQDPSAVCFPLTVDITSPTVTLGSTGNGLLSYWTDVAGTIPLVGSSAVTTSGVYYIKSTAAGNCTDIKPVNVTVNTSPVLVISHPAEVCEPAMVDLTDPKVTLGSGAGQITYCSNITGTSVLTTPTSIKYSGTYYIKNTQNGCSTILPVNVTINPKPKANFTPTPAIVTTINPVSTMMNSTIDAVGYSWVFNDGGVSGETNPEHVFPDKEQSNQLVILIATSDKGCRDTTSKMVVVNEQLLYFVPNTFTPDGDDFNQTFKPIFTSGYTPSSYHLTIFDRWGEIVFESYDPEFGWEGKLGKDGNLVQVGTYTWKIQFKLKADDRRKEIVGYVNIIK